jgi:hypothetical protein
MKTRTVILLVGLSTTLALGGLLAWRSSLVRSWFARDTDNPAEAARSETADVKNVAPPDARAGSPGWRGATRMGVAPADAFRTDWEKNPPKELWRVPIGGGYGSCAVVGGRVYVQDRQGEQERVVCLDAETGRTVWAHAYPPGRVTPGQYNIGPRATPTVADGRVYTVGEGGVLLALEPTADGVAVKWSHDLVKEFDVPKQEWGVAGSPLVYRDTVIVQPGGKRGAVVAFDRETGAQRWAAGTNPPGYSSPVVAPIGGQDTVFAFLGDALLAVRPTDGKVTDSYGWQTEYCGNIATPMVLSDQGNTDYVFISSAYGKGSAKLRAERSGDEVKLVEVYKRPRLQFHHMTPVYKDRHLYGVVGQTGTGGLRCVEFGAVKEVPDWEDRKIGQASAILAGEHLLLQTARGELWLVEANPKECNVIGKTKQLLSGNNNWATPTLVEGRIYVRDEQNVVCLDVRSAQ